MERQRAIFARLTDRPVIIHILIQSTGFHVNVITIRKLVFEQDPFAFGDKVLETWYPTIEVGSNKGNLLLVKSSKEGAIVGGPAFGSHFGIPKYSNKVSLGHWLT